MTHLKHALAALALVLALTSAPPARAHNPRIDLKVENATIEVALDELSKRAEVSVQLYTQQRRGVQVNANFPGSDKKATYSFQAETFARILRKICEDYNLRPQRNGGGYVLYPAGQPPAGPLGKKVGLVEKNGVQLYVASLSTYESRQINFVNENAFGGGGNLNLQIRAELGDQSSEYVAGFQNITARDDTGNVMTDQNRGGLYGGYSTSAYPDEWTGSISLPNANPKAKKILWLEGDFVIYRKVRTSKVELPIKPGEKLMRTSAGDAIFAVSRYRETPEAPEVDPEEEKELPQLRGLFGHATGPTMRVRVYQPSNTTRLVSRNGGYGMQPSLVCESGRVYSPTHLNTSSRGDGQFTLHDMNLSFPSGDDKPVKLVWDFLEREDPVKLFTFRMTDIPLPEPDKFIVREQPRVAPALPKPPASERPFYEKDGGVLVSKIEAPVARLEGTMQIGLAPREGTGFGAVRWIEVDIFVEGNMRLEDVKPGVYRILRRFKPKDAERFKTIPAGAWQNSEVQAAVVAGKEVVLAPLRWGATAKPPATPTRPAPTVKPPARPKR